MPANGHYTFPPELYYDPATHVWARPSGETVTVGLDALGLESLGDMAYISLEAIGFEARRGAAMGSLEAAKMVGELVAPLSGTVAARNEAALADPGLVNRDPYGEGWLIAIRPSAWSSEVAALVHGDGLAKWAQAETERYRAQGWIE